MTVLRREQKGIERLHGGFARVQKVLERLHCHDTDLLHT